MYEKQFKIDDALAKELSELITIQKITERLLHQNINNPTEYDAIMKKLIPITDSIELIKRRITNEFVPPEFRSVNYVWDYEGYVIAGNVVRIIELNNDDNCDCCCDSKYADDRYSLENTGGVMQAANLMASDNQK